MDWGVLLLISLAVAGEVRSDSVPLCEWWFLRVMSRMPFDSSIRSRHSCKACAASM